MSTPKKKQTRPTVGVTVGEFKQWLSGVEDMQPTDWTPDSGQWKKIREKIRLLIDAEPIVQEVPVVQQPTHHQYIPEHHQFFEPSNTSTIHHRHPSPNQSSLAPVQRGEVDYSVPGTTEFS